MYVTCILYGRSRRHLRPPGTFSYEPYVTPVGIYIIFYTRYRVTGLTRSCFLFFFFPFLHSKRSEGSCGLRTVLIVFYIFISVNAIPHLPA